MIHGDLSVIEAVARQTRGHVCRKHGNPPFAGCLVASKMIVRLLRKRGFEAYVVHGQFRGVDRRWKKGWARMERGYEPHWWVECQGLLIDVTADQFEGEDREVVIGPASELREWESEDASLKVCDWV